MRAKNHSSKTSSLNCEYNEYVAGSKLNGVDNKLDFQPSQIKEAFWRFLKPSSSLSSFTNLSSEFFKDAYKEHLGIWNGFTEGNPKKNGFEEFDNAFKSIINNTVDEPVPVNPEGHLANGAHRLAAALYRQRLINIRNTNSKENYTIEADYKVFLKKGLHRHIMKRTALEYAKLKTNTHVVCLFPIAHTRMEEVMNIIEKHIKNMNEVEGDSGQKIVIKSLSPLRCKNACHEKPTGGRVTQFLNVDIATENIISDITKNISETYISMTNTKKSSLSTVNVKELYLFAGFSVLLIVTLYIICYLVFFLLYVFFAKRRPPSEYITHMGAIFLMIIVYLFWAIIVCIIRSGGGIRMMFCMF